MQTIGFEFIPSLIKIWSNFLFISFVTSRVVRLLDTMMLILSDPSLLVCYEGCIVRLSRYSVFCVQSD